MQNVEFSKVDVHAMLRLNAAYKQETPREHRLAVAAGIVLEGLQRHFADLIDEESSAQYEWFKALITAIRS